MKQVYTFSDLQNWSRLQEKSASPVRLGVFGDPVAHSLSPQIQNAALRACKMKMQYARFEIRADELPDALRLTRQHDFLGLSLTIPHKVAALSSVDDFDENAGRVGAVNTIKIENRRLRGFNTDGAGFSRAIREEFSVDLRDLRVMILGAGGAARAIALQCAKENCERLVIANRTAKKAEELSKELQEFFARPKVFGPMPRLQAIGWEESAFRFQIANVDLVVNATPLGLKRSDPSPIPSRLLAPHLMIFDTIYSAQRTPFVSAAIGAGARAANGLTMLLHQGTLAFEIWFEREAPIDSMRAALGVT